MTIVAQKSACYSLEFYFIITNYDRFFLNNIESIEFRPKQKLQLLLGTNGSGKSSLLSELNPLPINKNDFTNGGKEITIEKDNNIFKLKSTSNKNSFMLNNTELNDGGTKTVQLNLVKEYFNLTPKYNNIILGTEKLTAMSTNERKNILREMSTVDYSYGIYLYNTLKQELRDTVGYLKLMQIEMNNDISNIVNDDEILILKNDITKCKNMIDSLSMSYSKSEEYRDIPIIDLNIDMDILDKNKLQADLDYNNKFIINIEEEITNLNKEIDSLDDYSTTIKGIPIRIKTTIDGKGAITFEFKATLSSTNGIINHSLNDVIKIISVHVGGNTITRNLTYNINFPSVWVQ